MGVAAAEAALVGGIAVLGGADLSNAMNMGGLYDANVKQAWGAPKSQSNKWAKKAQQYAKDSGVGPIQNAIAPVRRTMIGNCGLVGADNGCGAASRGIVPRADAVQSVDSGLAVFVESNGETLRYESAF